MSSSNVYEYRRVSRPPMKRHPCYIRTPPMITLRTSHYDITMALRSALTLGNQMLPRCGRRLVWLVPILVTHVANRPPTPVAVRLPPTPAADALWIWSKFTKSFEFHSSAPSSFPDGATAQMSSPLAQTSLVYHNAPLGRRGRCLGALIPSVLHHSVQNPNREGGDYRPEWRWRFLLGIVILHVLQTA